MKRLSVALIALLSLALSLPASAWIRSPATTFATLPSGATPPEGLTTGPNGDVYASTFGFPESGASSNPGQIIVWDSHGKLLRQMVVVGASPHLLGLAFNPVTHDFLVLDFGAGKVLRVNPLTGAVLGVFADIFAKCTSMPGLCPITPAGFPPGFPGLNALTFDSAGNVYISDSFQGIIWKLPPGGGTATAWVSDVSLQTSGLPPFGANGLAFNNEGNVLYVANTGNDSVVGIAVNAGVPAPAADFKIIYSINGADGLIIDQDDNIWVCANQSDEIVVLDKTGKVIAKLGDFDGIDSKGAVRGLLFPASLVFSGEFLLVTNLVLDTRLFGFTTLDSQWAAQVKQYTVSKINRHLPPTHGEHD
ncbi:MAG TPA: SMP-30/gluconolactonase/LRE family protein [Casimicrobiaceae bacterium]|nr:SMP-30/gluconolactonase/LRE family protein [Casimicrobiaceae bacterium]